MGVQGLWNILHCTGRDIDLSSLEGKILAIDLSIWLNQALKSGIDSPTIHLEILFRRISKLLFYNIKPIFVFDGPTPYLKKETILIRRKQRQMMQDKSENIKCNIINLLMKKKLTQKTKQQGEIKRGSTDLFKLPQNEYFDSMLINNNDMNSGFSDIAHDYLINLPSTRDIDFESESFLSMPLEVQHEIIRNIAKEKRYGHDTTRNSFDQKSGQDFSQLQIQKLLNRNILQQKVEYLRSSMNYQNNQNVISSLDCKQMNKLSPSEIQSKKILSHKEAYLMMIDPSENDLVDSLTKLKREHMFKNVNTNKSIQESRYDNTSNRDDREAVFENNDTSDSQDHLFQRKDKIENVDHETLTNRDIALPVDDRNVADIPQNYSIKETDESDIKNSNELDKSDITKDLQQVSGIKDDISKIEDKKFYVNQVSDLYKCDQTEEYSSLDKPSMLCQVFNEENCDYLLSSFGTEINANKFDDTARGIFCSTELPINTLPLSDDENKRKDVVNNTTNYQEEALQNDEDIEVTNESDDDFIDVPEMELEKDNPEEMEETEKFSDMDIAMILSDPDQWQRQIDETIDTLQKEERKIDSQAASLSERYYEEAKELLKLFGIPYVESPGEAEAQCAFLENANLTDGTITEDSDIWLFGGRMVYKHVFSRDQSVRAYNHEFIKNQLGLSRDLMICIALLSGSDYAPGIHGIGPVIAMEILAEFSDPDVDQTHLEILESFKNWHDKWSKDPATYIGNSDKKRFLRFSLDTNFLNHKVIEAYNKPLVNESAEQFIWSQPAIDKLLEFAQKKIGWSKLKVLEILELVVNKKTGFSRAAKRTILDYFTESAVDQLLNSKKSPSKRLKLATKKTNSALSNLSRPNK